MWPTRIFSWHSVLLEHVPSTSSFHSAVANIVHVPYRVMSVIHKLLSTDIFCSYLGCENSYFSIYSKEYKHSNILVVSSSSVHWLLEETTKNSCHLAMNQWLLFYTQIYTWNPARLFECEWEPSDGVCMYVHGLVW